MQTSSTDEFKRYGICIVDTQPLFIFDVLLFLLKFRFKSIWLKPQHTPMNENKRNTSDLVELLQKSAVEHLTTFRQLEARDFGFVSTSVSFVTTDFEAMYAYKRGEYQRCLQLSTQNVRILLLYGAMLPNVLVLPEFIQFLGDDIVSLTALTLIVSPECRYRVTETYCYFVITQLTLLLYLMTQCQLKLHHSVTSVAQTLRCIKVAQRIHPADRTLDHLTLKLTERKVIAYVSTQLRC